ncbi:hypothetical protein BXZ70DRAFT_1080645 [Cristinia sonorae]|uniref:Uncharacterized protein n=1 Tax=Cristinia sonorae TaxID=1940300 RepID=A0A8K0UFH6_9AGAR|nr:hypothetical protein BXZ70DRAFT_1080645 [Cristinia sonorae]
MSLSEDSGFIRSPSEVSRYGELRSGHQNSVVDGSGSSRVQSELGHVIRLTRKNSSIRVETGWQPSRPGSFGRFPQTVSTNLYDLEWLIFTDHLIAQEEDYQITGGETMQAIKELIAAQRIQELIANAQETFPFSFASVASPIRVALLSISRARVKLVQATELNRVVTRHDSA